MPSKSFLSCLSIQNKMSSCGFQIWAVKCSLLFLSSHLLWSYFMCMHVCVLTKIPLGVYSHVACLLLPAEETCYQQSINCVSVYASIPQAKIFFVWVRIFVLIISISKWKMLAVSQIYIISQSFQKKSGSWNIFICTISLLFPWYFHFNSKSEKSYASSWVHPSNHH